MINCTKRQREIYKGEKQHRCVHRESDLFKQMVVDEQCSACPLLNLYKVKQLECAERARLDWVAERAGEVPPPEPGTMPVCPFRYEQNTGEKVCSITGLGVDIEICSRCDSETREHEATFGDKVKHYFGAVRKWVASGRPTRSEEEVKELFDTHCRGCDRYDPEAHSCKSCGCKVNYSSQPLSNKLAMKTESCPLGRF